MNWSWSPCCWWLVRWSASSWRRSSPWPRHLATSSGTDSAKMGPVATYLDRILHHHRDRVAADGRPDADLRSRCEDLPETRGFVSALAGRSSLGVISEVKRR